MNANLTATNCNFTVTNDEGVVIFSWTEAETAITCNATELLKSIAKLIEQAKSIAAE